MINPNHLQGSHMFAEIRTYSTIILLDKIMVIKNIWKVLCRYGNESAADHKIKPKQNDCSIAHDQR